MTTGTSRPQPGDTAQPERRDRWEGRSALLVPGILLALGCFLVYGIVDMEVTDDAELFGPKAFPWITAVACFVVAGLLAVSIVRDPSAMLDRDGTPVTGTSSNWRATGITVGSFVVFVLLLQPLGWIITAALTFWGVTVGLGSTRYVLNLLIGLALSSVMQLVFAELLGLSLPPGVMAWS